jgi:hypothetical protein
MNLSKTETESLRGALEAKRGEPLRDHHANIAAVTHADEGELPGSHGCPVGDVDRRARHP